MIITQTPVRISFFGGGTDYPAHFRRHGGAVLVSAIDQYVLITVHRLEKFAEHEIRVHYSQVESVNGLDEIRHPSARECLRFMGIDRGIEVHYVNDLPARTGLGSSSAATVGLLHALHAFKRETVAPAQLAAEAVYVEQQMIKERVGSQDQYASALGGLTRLAFACDGAVHAHPVDIAPHRLQALNDRLMLLYTGVQRHAHDVLVEQVARTESGANDGELKRMGALVEEGIEVLTEHRNLAEFGALLHDAWALKRELSTRVSTPLVDDAYARARKAGAVGGKLLGAGGGGFLLLYVEPADRAQVRAALSDLREVQFAFERSGSAIILDRPGDERRRAVDRIPPLPLRPPVVSA
jgi:D-glycero-alpha-D-manno-heptose-7-phosphate kinase